jgi:hypothetical protein
MSPAGTRGHSEAGRSAQAADRLDRGRRFYEARAWRDAYDELAQADGASPLGAADVELLATCAYMLGSEDEWMRKPERAHHLHVDAGEIQRAVRCVFFIGANLALRGEMGGATGWLGRGQRLLDRDGRDCVERGYLLVIEELQQLASGDSAAAAETVAAIAEIGQRFEDPDLFALAVHDQGYRGSTVTLEWSDSGAPRLPWSPRRRLPSQRALPRSSYSSRREAVVRGRREVTISRMSRRSARNTASVSTRSRRRPIRPAPERSTNRSTPRYRS